MICRSFSLYKRGKTSLAFIFHKGLHDFKAALHKRLKKRKWGETVPVATVYSIFKLLCKDSCHEARAVVPLFPALEASEGQKRSV